MCQEYDSWNESYKNDSKDHWIAFTPMELRNLCIVTPNEMKIGVTE